MATTLETLEERVRALEARQRDIERAHGGTLYRLERFRVRTDLNMANLLRHFGIAPATEGEVDAVLDAE